MEKLVLLDSNSLANRAYYAIPLLTNKEGIEVNAVYGYLNMLIKIINDIKPTHIAAAFDMHAPTFRKKRFDAYKAKRKAMPDELVRQMPMIKEMLKSMNIAIIEMEGYEADDIIGTLARSAIDTYIITGDKDSLQLVSDNTRVWLTKRGISDIVEYTPERLKEDGLTASQVIDLKALMGDSSDNIPGVPGVGEKTARALLIKYGDIEGVYAHIDEISGKLHDKLKDNEELCRLSYELATIDRNVPIDVDDDRLKINNPYNERSKELMLEYSFKSVVDRLEFSADTDAEPSVRAEETEVRIESADELKNTIKAIDGEKIALYIGDSIEFSVDGVTNYIVEIAQGFLDEGMRFDEAVGIIGKVTADADVVKICYDIKALKHELAKYGASMVGRNEDVLLKAYLMDANINFKDFDSILNYYSVKQSMRANALYVLNAELDRVMPSRLRELYDGMEYPLIDVLYDMEVTGFKVDRGMLKTLKREFKERMDELSDAIKKLSGEDFNVNSPKQLGVVLFEKMGLKGGKKTKTGYSTNVDVLNAVKGQHPIVDMILKYRDIQKIWSTYLEGLEQNIDSDSRVRTCFKQAVTATGRLSSTEPNLQNLPVRKTEGKIIRKMFTASSGNKIVCADYSQIELRIMAHYSNDPILLGAFNNGEDIHTTTAAKVFGVDISEVTPDMRRSAKAVNFGIIYGISDFGLAADLGISPREARRFIDRYFETYPNVHSVMLDNVALAKEKGYAESLFGRIRKIPELRSSNFNTRGFGERVAMNMPLQGSASDIIKIAMIKVYDALKEGGYKAKLIMQVHDELLVDAPEDEAESVAQLLKREMENAAQLRVKLDVDVSIGNNWLEAK